ncbi:glycine cleavage system protein GcvH [Nocardioides taihuensis]|uniref:Glycine cleavage system H protein n=1 Tax=Nocardioides taihuensis TaxID=1835606 RepID=A0ABW0BEE1_9ACTN
MNIPADLKYSDQHEWVSIEGNVATVGITEHAAEALGDIVFVELPEPGAAVSAGSPCGEIESTKSVSDLFSPVDGSVSEINQTVIDDSAVVNVDPYGNGWLFRVTVDDLPQLLSATEYAALVDGEAT